MEFFDKYDVKKIENIELLAKQVVEGFIIGLHKSPFHGFSVEFAEHRIYNQGESTKNIDWKVFARTEKLFVKRYEEETNLRCQIVIDTSSSMYFPEDRKEGELNKLEFSALAAASLMNLLKKQRDAYGLSLFEEELKIHTHTKTNTSHYRLMLTYLEKLIKEKQMKKTTSAAAALHAIAERVHRRSLVIIFSDMFEQTEDQEAMFSALQHLKYNKHEVVLFHVMDEKLEMNFEFENRPYLFVDMESGDEIKLQSNQIKELYKEKVVAQREALKMKCLQYKIDYVETDINKGFSTVLETYLVKRKKMRG